MESLARDLASSPERLAFGFLILCDSSTIIAARVEDGLTVFVKHPEGKETFQPFWPEAESDIRNLTENRAREIYGEPLPDIVRARLEKIGELSKA